MRFGSAARRLRGALHWRLQALCDKLAPESPGKQRAETDPSLVLRSMADYVCAARDTRLDPELSALTVRCLVDTLACIFAGADTDEGRVLMAASGVQRGQLFSSGAFHAPREHAFLLAALAQVHDANDGNAAAGSRGAAHHPGRVILPAAIALGLHGRTGGGQFLKAVAAGYDVACATSGAPLEKPATAFGAAAVSAVMSQLTAEQVAFLLRVAGFMAPRSGAQDFETNNLTVAQQAAAALLASELVGCGYPLSRTRKEFLLAPRFCFERPGCLGESLRSLYQKPYPSCRYTHYPIEAALALREQVVTAAGSDSGGKMAEAIDSILITMPGSWRGPSFPVGADEYFKCYQFSAPYCVAVALVDGQVGLRQFSSERYSDPDVQRLQSKVSVEGLAPGIGREISVRIVMKNGVRLHETRNDASGSPANPLSDEQLKGKFTRAAAPLGIAADELHHRLSRIDSVGDISEVLQL